MIHKRKHEALSEPTANSAHSLLAPATHALAPFRPRALDSFRRDLHLKTNFILVDYENVQPQSVSLLKGGPFKLKIFVGSQQTRIQFDLAHSTQGLGDAAEYVPIEGNGRNALDFHIAFYIGRLAATEPDAFFHIISRDTGFDVLIKYLHAQKIFCKRSESLDQIPLLKTVGAKTLDDKVAVVVANLTARRASKPRKMKTLTSTIASLFSGQLESRELERIVAELQKRAVIHVVDGKVSYESPAGPPAGATDT